MREDEVNLVRQLRERDPKAFETFIRKHQNMIFSLALRLMNNYAEAEDITQDIFITVFKQIESFRGDSSLSTWLYRIAVNHCKNRIKYLSRRQTVQEKSGPDDRPIERSEGYLCTRPDKPDEALEGKETEALINAALAELDEDHRTIMLLREIESMSYQEIAEVMKLEEGTVKSKLHRARSAFFAHYHRFKEEKGNKAR